MNKFPMIKKKRLLTVAEHDFLKCLERALIDDYHVFTRVRLLDLSNFDKQAGFLKKRLTNKKLADVCADFVLCKKDDMSIQGVVELEKFDKLTSAKQKQRREKLLSSVCKAADIRLFYFDGRQDYTGMDLCRLITGRSKPKVTNRKIASAEASMVSVEEGDSMMETDAIEKVRSCPKCYSDVVIKIAVKGENIGEKFLMCRKYPYCDYQIPVKDALVKDLQEKEEQRRGKAGYRNW